MAAMFQLFCLHSCLVEENLTAVLGTILKSANYL